MNVDQNPIVPREAVTGTAAGLMMMTVFTTIWAGIASAGLTGSYSYLIIAGFGAFEGAFLVYGFSLFRQAKKFPQASSEADIARKKKTGMWFGIIFGAEGLGIFIAVNVVINLGHPELVIPAIALIVGLHFYPLAKVFRRKIDYYLATWATLVAVLGFVFSLNKILDEHGVFTFVGIGTAIATSCYGIYMIYYGSRIIKQQNKAVKL